ncbi:hypothetical protein AK812_SmicGene43157, partial [Symbiodinium microadriaticum]
MLAVGLYFATWICRALKGKFDEWQRYVRWMDELHKPSNEATAAAAIALEGGSMETDRNQEPAASPKKRGAAEEERISLDAIREVVRGEIGVSTATLLTEIGARMDRVETGVTAQLERTLERLQTITAQQRDQQQTVEAIQGNQQRMNARLQTLEAKVQTLQQSGTGSTVDTESGGRKPALQRRDFAFVPGVRRGYAILPYGCRENESAQDLRERLSGALRRVKQANIAMGTNSEGKTRYLWMQLSQSPERRRRVQLAGKCKRLCLSFGAAFNQIETEWPTGTVWFKGTRVCSATTTKPAQPQEAGAPHPQATPSVYTGTLPAAVEKGLTVLLPKEAQPGDLAEDWSRNGWGQTIRGSQLCRGATAPCSRDGDQMLPREGERRKLKRTMTPRTCTMFDMREFTTLVEAMRGSKGFRKDQRYLTLERFSCFCKASVLGPCVVTLEAPACFGELALKNTQPRAATVKCRTKCRLMILEKQHVLHVLTEVMARVRFFNDRLPGIGDAEYRMDHPCQYFSLRKFPQGYQFTHEGIVMTEPALYVLKSGALEFRRYRRTSQNPVYVLSHLPMVESAWKSVAARPRTGVAGSKRLGSRPKSRSIQ